MFQQTSIRVLSLSLTCLVFLLAVLQTILCLFNRYFPVKFKTGSKLKEKVRFTLMKKIFLTTYILILIHDVNSICLQVSEYSRADERLIESTIITPLSYSIFYIINNFLYTMILILWLHATYLTANLVFFVTKK